MPESYSDTQLRNAAFAHVQQLMAMRDQLKSDDLRAGFQFEGERIPLINPQRGIFKPQRIQYLLSIRTVYPKAGGRIWYDDQREVHKQIYRGDDTVEYAFMGKETRAPRTIAGCATRILTAFQSSTSSACRQGAIPPSSRHSSSIGMQRR